MKEREITALEEGLGYHFRRRAVIEQAVTHSSQAREQEAQQAGESKYRVSDNEQLEFLGDAVLQLVTSEELFQRFPHFREGELSKLRAHLVSERHLIRVAQQLELGHYLRLGRGEEKSGGRGKTALLVDAFEAILAAIYLDGGLEVARESSGCACESSADLGPRHATNRPSSIEREMSPLRSLPYSPPMSDESR